MNVLRWTVVRKSIEIDCHENKSYFILFVNFYIYTQIKICARTWKNSSICSPPLEHSWRYTENTRLMQRLMGNLWQTAGHLPSSSPRQHTHTHFPPHCYSAWGGFHGDGPCQRQALKSASPRYGPAIWLAVARCYGNSGGRMDGGQRCQAGCVSWGCAGLSWMSLFSWDLRCRCL